jgi:hypothetical protein
MRAAQHRTTSKFGSFARYENRLAQQIATGMEKRILNLRALPRSNLSYPGDATGVWFQN